MTDRITGQRTSWEVLAAPAAQAVVADKQFWHISESEQ